MNDRKTIDFVYYGENGKDNDSRHTLRVTKVAPSSPINLLPLNNETLRCVPDHEWSSVGNRHQTCNWFVYEGDKISVGLFHGRDYFPWNIYKRPSYSYWLCDIDFPTVLGAITALLSKGCDITKWHCQRHFYVETGYFLITQDFDEALKFLGYYYTGDMHLNKT